jgi:hypothetical protein
MMGHRLMGTTLLTTGDIAAAREHLDQAILLYDPAEHRPLATRFGQDVGVAALYYRSLALWSLGYPEAALTDTDDAISNARAMGQAATLMYALGQCQLPYTVYGNHVAVAAQAQELVALAEEKGALLWNAGGMMRQGSVLALTGRLRTRLNVDLRDYCLADNGSDHLDAIPFAALGARPCGAWDNSSRRGAASAKR